MAGKKTPKERFNKLCSYTYSRIWRTIEKLCRYSYRRVWALLEKMSVKDLEELLCGAESRHRMSENEKEVYGDILLERWGRLNKEFTWTEENIKKFCALSDNFCEAWEKGLAKAKELIDIHYEHAAKRLGLEERQVRQWINDNQYVWHERQDGKHIDLLCHDIHGNIPHSGEISANKQRLNR